MRAAAPAPPEAPEVTLLRADRFVELGNQVPVRGVSWLLAVDDELQAWSLHAMPARLAIEWAERWLRVERGVPMLRAHCLDDMDEGHWAIETPVSAWLDDDGPTPEPPPRRRRRWRRDPPPPAPSVEVTEPAPEPAGPPEPAPAPAASRGERWPRFLVERAPSWFEAVDYARRGAWSTSPPGAAARWWHVAYAHTLGALVLAVAALLAWSAVRPVRLVTVAALVAVVATALNPIPGVGLLVPDALTITTWWEALP